MNPKHHNPTKKRPRGGWAHAPYNFVPLPEKVVTVDAEDIPDHDIYTEHSGYIDCVLETRSPLYTRCALKPKFFRKWAERIQAMMQNSEARNEYAQFFHLEDAQVPVIPGSSLRGMVRTLVEIAGYGKMQWVTDAHLFFRTVDNTAIGTHYRNRMTGKIETGFLRYQNGSYSIKKCRMIRIHRDRLGGKIYAGKTPNLTPRWDGQPPRQYIPVWVTLDRSGNVVVVEDVSYESTNDAKEGRKEGRLVITGDVPGKKKEFIFLLPEPNAEEIPVSDEILRRFHDDDQITRWQERAFPKDKPQGECRYKDGAVRKESFLQGEGDPVFFLREGGKLTFFGRAQMFRLPYIHSPLDLVPDSLHQHSAGKIDIAESIFGYVPEGERKSGRAGRVFFTQAVCEPHQGEVFEKVITPRILASPKPTAFQHYLVHHNPDSKNDLAHYDTPTGETTIRGHKLYWHRGQVTPDQVKEGGNVDWNTDTQHTSIRPVKASVHFRFRIYFENLRDFELGALLWALTLPGEEGKEYCHSLGMGKPLGMGAVKITPTLRLIDRKCRYSRLLDGADWARGERREEANVQQFISDFENFVLQKMDAQERGQAHSLKKVERIQMLLKMLEWSESDPQLTKYMELNEYRERPVLPDPLNIKRPPGGGLPSAKRPAGKSQGGRRRNQHGRRR